MFRPGDEPVPGYRLEEMLGQGGVGEVWRATAPGGPSVALKLINLSGEHGSKEFRAIRKVKEIRHAHLLPMTAFWILDQQGNPLDDSALEGYDRGGAARTSISGTGPAMQRTPSTLVVAMVLGDKSLADRLDECRRLGLPGIPPQELLEYMEDAARGIDFLNSPRHDLGAGAVAVQHGDVKPQNIMLVGDSALVCDFGLVRVFGDSKLTAVAGTPAYMPPECIQGHGPSATSDQYAMAVSYYELRTGSLPFADESYSAVLTAHLEGRLDLSQLPPGERDVVRRATALDPGRRFPSTLSMVRALQEAVKQARPQSADSDVLPVGPILATTHPLLEDETTLLPIAPAESFLEDDVGGGAAMAARDIPIELRGKMGRNAYGTVFHGWDRKLNRAVAVMELHRKFRSDPARLDASWTQVMHLAALTHDHIVPIFFGEKDPGWIVMELMQANLAERLREGPLDPELVRSVLRQCLEALDFLHAHHTVHGDVRPATILVSAQGQIKLSFSVGVALCGEIPWELRSLKYVAPELLDPEFGPAGPATDLYCLGFSALELLVGPKFDARFQRTGEKPEAVWAHWHGSRSRQLPKAKQLVADVPADLARVIDRLLVKEVSGRYASAAETLADLPPETMPVPEVAKRLTQSGLHAAECTRHAPRDASPLVEREECQLESAETLVPSPNWAGHQRRTQGSRAPRYVTMALVLAILIVGGAIGWQHRPEIEAFLRTRLAARQEQTEEALPSDGDAESERVVVEEKKKANVEAKLEPEKKSIASEKPEPEKNSVTSVPEVDTQTPKPSEEAVAHYRSGVAANDQDDYDKAVVELTEALRARPQYPEAYEERGIAYMGQREWEKAINDFSEAIKLNPKFAKAYNNRGNAYKGLEKVGDAIDDYTKAIQLEPDKAMAYINRGIAYRSQGKITDAIADYSKAIELDPNRADTYYFRARARFEDHDADAAIADCTEAIRLDPKHAGAYGLRASAYQDKGDVEKADADRAKQRELTGGGGTP